jgi:dihydrofolate reductase
LAEFRASRARRILYYNTAVPLPARISIIAALARNRAIGRDNGMPWRLPEDLKRFRRLTMGSAVVMGRKTFESIGSPLAGRNNIVITRSRDWHPSGCLIAHTLESALVAAAESPATFVIGGAQIYALALPHAQCLHLTEIEGDFEGDAFFPEYDRSQWREVAREPYPATRPDAPAYAFVRYERRN